jgi:hypothetical protein
MSEHVYFNDKNRLEYTPDEIGNIIPDFSHVGYKYGDEQIPHVEVKIQISPSAGDDGQRIQDAINYVSALPVEPNGYRGAVLLKSGVYEVAGQINITADGVVLRGEGQTESGTVILGTGIFKRTLLWVNGSGSLSEISGSRRDIVESYVPVGRKYVLVSNTDGYREGDDFVIYRPGTENWINDIKMNQIPPDPSGGSVTQWSPSSYNYRFERVVAAVRGDTIFFRNPVVMAIEDKYGGGRVYKSQFTGRIKNVGVENILFKSEYASNTDENHAWTAVEFSRAMHSWVRDITAKHFGYAAVSIDYTAKHISVIDCSSLEPKSQVTGSRRYSFNVNGQLNLVFGCHASEGRHDYILGSRVCGLNVFSNSTAEKASNDIGPHHRWATGALFDNITTNHSINVQDRSYMGSGHGWAGANMVLWNCKANTSVTQNPWASAKNYNIGFTGTKHPGAFPGRPDGEWEGHNTPGINPQSLYLAQMEDRKWDSEQFRVFNQLELINHETLMLTFNKDIDVVLGTNPQHYLLSGSAGLSGNPLSALVAFGNSVFLTVPNMDFLERFSTIKITLSEKLADVNGNPITGEKTVSLIFPDLRPVIESSFQNLNTDTHEFAIARVSKVATIYLVITGTTVNNINDLDLAVTAGRAVKQHAPTAFDDVELPISSLRSGVYYFYAVDDAGRISEPGTNAVIITSTVGVSGLKMKPRITIENEYIRFFNEFDTNDKINIQLIDLRGRVVLNRFFNHGENKVKIPDVSGIHIVRILSKKSAHSIMVHIPQNN